MAPKYHNRTPAHYIAQLRGVLKLPLEVDSSAPTAIAYTRWLDQLDLTAEQHWTAWNVDEKDAFAEWCRLETEHLRQAVGKEPNLWNISLKFYAPGEHERLEIEVTHQHPLRSIRKSAFIPDSRRGPLTWGAMRARGRWA
ncbi:hypothetical protein JCM11641_007037 [Rhodosporidiobolus odoratus]